jgi:hypothetical protein
MPPQMMRDPKTKHHKTKNMTDASGSTDAWMIAAIVGVMTLITTVPFWLPNMFDRLERWTKPKPLCSDCANVCGKCKKPLK